MNRSPNAAQITWFSGSYKSKVSWERHHAFHCVMLSIVCLQVRSRSPTMPITRISCFPNSKQWHHSNGIDQASEMLIPRISLNPACLSQQLTVNSSCSTVVGKEVTGYLDQRLRVYKFFRSPDPSNKLTSTLNLKNISFTSGHKLTLVETFG
jgi:hypothetical protein